jgi:hypothetical protein
MSYQILTFSYTCVLVPKILFSFPEMDAWHHAVVRRNMLVGLQLMGMKPSS